MTLTFAQIPAIVRLALPICMAQLASIGILTSDLWMAGRLSTVDLATSALSTRLYHPFYFIALGILAVIAPLTAQALGSGDGKIARRTFRQGLIIAFVIGILSMPAVFYGSDILIFLGQDEALSRHAEPYLFWTSLGLPFTFVFLTMRFFSSGHGEPTPQLYATLLGLGLNIALNECLSQGIGPFAQMGLEGIALATTISYIVMALTLGALIGLRAPFRQVSPYMRWWVLDFHIIKRILRIGSPNGLLVLSETGMFIIAALLIGLFGTSALAAASVANQIAAIAFMVPLSLAQAAAIRVGGAAGAGHPALVSANGNASMICGALLAVPLTLVIFIFPEFLTGLFILPDDPFFNDVLVIAVPMLIITGIFQLADGMQAIITAALRGLNDTKIPAIIGLFGYWGAGIGSGSYMAFILDWGPVAIWAGLAVGLFVNAIILGIRWALRVRAIRAGKIPLLAL
jgi:MATE family multidrug resistance protein